MTNPHFESLNFNQPILVSCSGGRDSSAMILSLKDYVDDKTLPTGQIKILFGNTRVNLGSARETIQRLTEYTGFELVSVRYEGERTAISILDESFMRIPKAIDRLEQGKDVKNVFRCCVLLKERPLSNYAKGLLANGQDPQVLLGFTHDDFSINRRRLRNEAKKKGIFHKRIISTGLLHYYPLIRCTTKDIDRILTKHGFEDVKSSGCSICPYFVIYDSWRKKDLDSWTRSTNKAELLGVEPRATNQLPLRAFCSGDGLTEFYKAEVTQ